MFRRYVNDLLLTPRICSAEQIRGLSLRGGVNLDSDVCCLLHAYLLKLSSPSVGAAVVEAKNARRASIVDIDSCKIVKCLSKYVLLQITSEFKNR